MEKELITVVSSATTGIKNVYDITNQLIYNRKHNKIISKGELKYLEIKVTEAMEQERQSARHNLSVSAQDKLWDSYTRIIEHDPNSPFGLVALELFRDELDAYRSYNKSFDRLTESGNLL